jgi:uncharacterized protein YodC (DUF2158 family)
VNEFKAGDVVRLKGAGVNMTVEKVEDLRQPKPEGLQSDVALRPELSRVRCVWWSESSADYRRDAFPANALEAVRKP